MDNNELQHFILTRFNLLLWNKDKRGKPVRTIKWLEHRFNIFEKYCLPSIKGQVCKNFEWIVLFDSSTPERFKKRIEEYKEECPQLVPVYVEPKNGRFFAEIFRREVSKRVHARRVVTTYLDNDDAISIYLIEDLQQRTSLLEDGTFIYYSDGYQYYTDSKYVMMIHYPRNHFVSVVENGNPLSLKTIYGYGSHYYINKINGAKIQYICNQPMWCENIHEKNMGNDAYFLNAKMVKDEDVLIHDFSINDKIRHGIIIYIFRFLPRYAKTFIRRSKYFLFGRHW